MKNVFDEEKNRNLVFCSYLLDWFFFFFFFFHNYKLPIESDGIAHQNRYLGKDIERQKAIGKRLDCTFIRINSDSLNFDGDREINGMFCQMKQSIKKKFVDETTSRLLSL